MPFMPTRSVALLLPLVASGDDSGTDKKGLVLNDKWCTSVHSEPFSNQVSWFYTYGTRIEEPSIIQWANDNAVEFVPMIGWQFVNLPDGSKCYMNKAPLCTVSQIANVLKRAKTDMKVSPKYLIGFNEPYNHNLTGGEQAELWRKFVQPAALQAGLKLVTPTATRGKEDMLAFFLKRCWDHKDSAEPCDVEQIHAFAVHNYNCKASFWKDHYAADGDFRKSLKAAMKGYGGRDWDGYVSSRNFWVTETNCNWDGDEPKSVAQCKRIAGQVSGHGEGSIRTMNNLGSIERYAWWNTFNPNTEGRAKTQNARLVDASGTLTPVGRAYKNSWGAECSSEEALV